MLPFASPSPIHFWNLISPIDSVPQWFVDQKNRVIEAPSPAATSDRPQPKYRLMQIPVGYREVIETPKGSRTTEATWSFRAREAGTSVVLQDGRYDLIPRASASRPNEYVPFVTSAYSANFEKVCFWA